MSSRQQNAVSRRPGRALRVAGGVVVGLAAVVLAVASSRGSEPGAAAPPLSGGLTAVVAVVGLALVVAGWRVRWVRPLLGPADWRVLLDTGADRYAFDLDYHGTPSDPSDDTEVPDSFRVLRPSTGRSDLDGRDFCADLRMFTTP